MKEVWNKRVIITKKTRLTALERLHKGELGGGKRKVWARWHKEIRKISLNIQHFTYLGFRYETDPIDEHYHSDY